MTDWDVIRKEFEETTITMKALAEKHNVKPPTLRSRKNRESWERNDVTQRNDASDVATDKPGGQKENKNSKGNKGNKKAKAPPNNKNAVTHGLFAKWLPKETQDIMETIQNRSEADMLWDSIMFQYTAILRAQKIMFVNDQNDMSKEIKKEKESLEHQETEYELQFAWDKHANFLSAQSRALGTLSKLIKQFVTMTDEADERRQKLVLMTKQSNFLEERLKEIKGKEPDTSLMELLVSSINDGDKDGS